MLEHVSAAGLRPIEPTGLVYAYTPLKWNDGRRRVIETTYPGNTTTNGFRTVFPDTTARLREIFQDYYGTPAALQEQLIAVISTNLTS